MNIYKFKVATGNPLEINFMETALKGMFMFEFSVNELSDDNHELVARSYTEDTVSDERKPNLIRVADEIKNLYRLNLNIESYEGYIPPEEPRIETFSSMKSAIEICNLDGYYLDLIVNGKDVKPDFEMQYKFIYGKAPTKEQLEVFTDFMCGKTTMECVARVCGKDAEMENYTGPVNS